MSRPRIGIAGAGGIGSNVALHLVRSGVDYLKIIDFDRVEASNLNRQFYFYDQIGRLKVEALRENLQRIRPGTEIVMATDRINGDNCCRLFADCDLIVEGLDGQAEKKMLVEILAGSKTIVSACGISGRELAGIRKRTLGSCTIIGDFTTDCATAPLFSHKIGLIAAQMSACILNHYEAHHDSK